MTSDATVLIENLSYQYPRSPRLVLRDINFRVQSGEFLGIIGPTGAGKTTLCLALNGIVPQFYGGRFFGHVTVAGLDTLDHAIHRLAQHVALVLQDPETQLVANSVVDEIAFGLENIKLPRAEIRQRIEWALEAVRLEGLEEKHPSELSGGEKQRLAIAAALAMRPEVLVLDEPTSQLDPIGSEQVFATVQELNTRLGVTVILVSHASEELAESADRVALLAGGELIDLDTPDRIFAREDLYAKYAVRPPQVTQFFLELKKAGLQPATIPVTMDQAVQAYESIRADLDLVEAPATITVSQPADAPPLLSARDVEYTYPDGTRALRGVSLDVREGEYLVVVGQNGAGKTTLAKLFLHLLEPTAGEVRLAGRDVTDLPVSELARRVGFVAQNPDHQIFCTSVEAEVGFALRNLGMAEAELGERIEESLRVMGLSEHRASHPLSLPKGDRARVVIAAVLAMRPDILIFDEPTTGQDYVGATRILDVSRRLHQAGKTVIVITHQLYLMPGYADRVIVMGKGEILLDAPIRTAFHRNALLQRTFLSPPQIVRFAQRIASREGQSLPILTPEELVGHMTVRRNNR